MLSSIDATDIRRQANKLNDTLLNVISERNRVLSLIDSANQWWKSNAGEVFINEFMNIDKDVTSFIRNFENIVNSLNYLPLLIEQAERERRSKRIM